MLQHPSPVYPVIALWRTQRVALVAEGMATSPCWTVAWKDAFVADHPPIKPPLSVAPPASLPEHFIHERSFV